MNVRVIVALLLLAAPAWADTPPNAWEVAKSPEIAKSYAVHVEVERLMAGAALLKEKADAAEREGLIDAARTLRDLATKRHKEALGVLEAAGARTSPDPTLRFDLGAVLEDLRMHQEAAAVLKVALDKWPDAPGADKAWLAYAFANAYTEDSKEERRGYEKYLTLETEAPPRLVPMLNMAECDMRLGNLTDSVEEYRAVLSAAASLPNTAVTVDTSKLARWGLAVALDRSGDPYAAANAARLATQMDPPARDVGTYALPSRIETPKILDQTTVFFVPPYERKWYLALGETELAKQATDPRDALDHWRAVERFWSDYVAGARAHPGGDRWIETAQRKLEGAKKKREEVEAKARKLPARDASRPIFID